MAVLATRIWPSWRRTSLQPKGSRLGSPHARPKLGTDFRGGVLPEIEPRFPAPCRGNRGPISGETAGQAALLKTLGQHRAAPTMCVGARDVNITWHRPCVHMQETSTSHSIMDFCCVGTIYAASEFFQQNIFLDKTISNIKDI